jgi:hypothetical protein
MEWINLPKQYGIVGDELDGKGNYTVIDPNSLYQGKSYSDWVSDWLNWFLSADADLRNSGPVVFVRSKGLPNERTGANVADFTNHSERSGLEMLPDSVPGDVTGMMSYAKPYVNHPNVRVGGDRLQIYHDQGVLVPIIVAFSLRTSQYTDWGGMLDSVGLTIDYGDNPPDITQLTINDRDVVLPASDKMARRKGVMIENELNEFKKQISDEDELLEINSEIGGKIAALRKEEGDRNHRVAVFRGMDKDGNQNDQLTQEMTELSKVKIETKEMLKNIKENLEKKAQIRKERVRLSNELLLMQQFRITTPIITAVIPEAQYGRSMKDFIEEAPITSGSYPAMVDGYFVLFRFSPGTYWIHSWASAPREARGPYFSELLYQIEVIERQKLVGRVTRRRPSQNERILNQILTQKKESGDLTDPELSRFEAFFQTSEGPSRRPLIP